jgi:hypothetical protein
MVPRELSQKTAWKITIPSVSPQSSDSGFRYEGGSGSGCKKGMSPCNDKERSIVEELLRAARPETQGPLIHHATKRVAF